MELSPSDALSLCASLWGSSLLLHAGPQCGHLSLEKNCWADWHGARGSDAGSSLGEVGLGGSGRSVDTPVQLSAFRKAGLGSEALAWSLFCYLSRPDLCGRWRAEWEGTLGGA